MTSQPLFADYRFAIRIGNAGPQLIRRVARQRRARESPEARAVRAAGALAFSQTQGQPPLTFGSSVDIINLTVTVTDAQGRLVSGLDRDAFSVYEDGVKQELAIFNRDRLPLSVVLLMDASASMDEKLAGAQVAAKRFVSTLVAADRAGTAIDDALAFIAASNERIHAMEARAKASGRKRGR